MVHDAYIGTERWCTSATVQCDCVQSLHLHTVWLRRTTQLAIVVARGRYLKRNALLQVYNARVYSYHIILMTRDAAIIIIIIIWRYNCRRDVARDQRMPLQHLAVATARAFAHNRSNDIITAVCPPTSLPPVCIIILKKYHFSFNLCNIFIQMLRSTGENSHSRINCRRPPSPTPRHQYIIR